MIFRIAFVAVLLTVLASACSNKIWIECDTPTTIRTKNRALTYEPGDQAKAANQCQI